MKNESKPPAVAPAVVPYTPNQYTWAESLPPSYTQQKDDSIELMLSKHTQKYQTKGKNLFAKLITDGSVVATDRRIEQENNYFTEPVPLRAYNP